MIFGFDT